MKIAHGNPPRPCVVVVVVVVVDCRRSFAVPCRARLMAKWLAEWATLATLARHTGNESFYFLDCHSAGSHARWIYLYSQPPASAQRLYNWLLFCCPSRVRILLLDIIFYLSYFGKERNCICLSHRA